MKRRRTIAKPPGSIIDVRTVRLPITTNKQIQMPVVVEINHRGPSPPKIRAQPSLLRRIRKLETAAVAIQPPASRRTGHIEIRQAVPVDVTRANPP